MVFRKSVQLTSSDQFPANQLQSKDLPNDNDYCNNNNLCTPDTILCPGASGVVNCWLPRRQVQVTRGVSQNTITCRWVGRTSLIIPLEWTEEVQVTVAAASAVQVEYWLLLLVLNLSFSSLSLCLCLTLLGLFHFGLSCSYWLGGWLAKTQLTPSSSSSAAGRVNIRFAFRPDTVPLLILLHALINIYRGACIFLGNAITVSH